MRSTTTRTKQATIRMLFQKRKRISGLLLALTLPQTLQEVSRATQTAPQRQLCFCKARWFPIPPFFVDEALFSTASKTGERKLVQFRKNMNMYCTDVASTLLTAVNHVINWEEQHAGAPRVYPAVPTIIQFGDLNHTHILRHVNIPLLKKFR